MSALLSIIQLEMARRRVSAQPADMPAEAIVALAEVEAGLDAGDSSLVDRVRRVLAGDAPLPPALYATHNLPAVAELIAAAQRAEASDVGDDIKDGARFIDPDTYENMRELERVL
jgi:hypothetical protein